MQKFIEADYYELDWYYEECSDGNYGSCKTERGCVGPLSLRGRGCPGTFLGRQEEGGAREWHHMALTVAKAWWRGTAGGQGSWWGEAPWQSGDGVGMLGLWALHLSGIEFSLGWCVCVCACVCVQVEMSSSMVQGLVSSGSGPLALENPAFLGPDLGAQGRLEKKAEAASHLAVKSNELSCGIPQRWGWEMLGGAGRVWILRVWAGRVWFIPEETRQSFCGWSSLGRFQTPGNGTQVHSQATGEGPRAPVGLASNCIWHS